MKISKLAAMLCLVAMMAATASPVMAKGGRMGGGRMGGPSIMRTAPKTAPRQAETPSRDTTRPANGAAGQNAGRTIDQGIDPSEYGRRGGRTQGSAGGQNQANGTQNQFAGTGRGFFGGFSLWPWLWFAGHGSAAADEGKEAPQAEESGEDASSSFGQWWDSLVQSLRALFGL